MTPLTVMRHHKRAIMLLFAISVLFVISCDVICAANVDWIKRVNRAFEPPSALTGNTDNHSHVGHDRNNNQNFQGELKHFHSFQTSVETQVHCCNDHTNLFYQSLFKDGDYPEIKSTNLPSFHFPRIEVRHLGDLVTQSLNNQLFCIHKLPPVGGGRLRVFINSFLI